FPQLTNFDGEPVVFAKVRFPLHDRDRSQVEQLLDGTAGLERDSRGKSWTWKRPDTQAAAAKPQDRLSLGAWDESGALILGNIDLRRKWLVLAANSRERAEQGSEVMRRRLGGLIGEPITETQSVENALAERRERPDRAKPCSRCRPSKSRAQQ